MAWIIGHNAVRGSHKNLPSSGVGAGAGRLRASAAAAASAFVPAVPATGSSLAGAERQPCDQSHECHGERDVDGGQDVLAVVSDQAADPGFEEE
jgi:hypothetical protein